MKITDEMVERAARVIADGYYDSLPDMATYLQRKASTRDLVDKVDALQVARAALEAALTEPKANPRDGEHG